MPRGVYYPLALLVSACVWAVPTHVSAPVVPGNLGEISEDGTALLRLEEIDLRLEARNQRGRGAAVLLGPLGYPLGVIPGSWIVRDRSSMPLSIYVDFDPRESGFAFDPMAISLTPKDGSALRPEGYLGPGRAERARARSSFAFRCIEAGTGRELARSTESRTFPLEPGSGRRCFVLEFPPLSPDVAFSLALDGLTREGKRVRRWPVHFNKRAAETGRLFP
ncbi:MAG: hypothetical protein ACREMK_07820 [Gemmatimonadota bacterium]